MKTNVHFAMKILKLQNIFSISAHKSLICGRNASNGYKKKTTTKQNYILNSFYWVQRKQIQILFTILTIIKQTIYKKRFKTKTPTDTTQTEISYEY